MVTEMLDQVNASLAGESLADEFGEFQSQYTHGPEVFQESDYAKQLRAETIGVRLVCRKFCPRRALNTEQVKQASEPFGADSKMMSAAKKLLDIKFEPYKKVTALISQARTFWLHMSIDYPIQGIRLMRKSLVEVFTQEMQRINSELQNDLLALEGCYDLMRSEAKTRLADLYDPADYPDILRICFALEWDFPSVEPPDQLKQLNPALYKQQQELIAARFDSAVKMAEEAFTAELQELVSHLSERLTGASDDGKPKVFKASAVENLREFFDRFQKLSIHSSPELEKLVKEAEQVLSGVDAVQLRKDQTVKARVGEDLSSIAKALDDMIVAKPSRMISLEDE